jgi:signal transduction histidine kinase
LVHAVGASGGTISVAPCAAIALAGRLFLDGAKRDPHNSRRFVCVVLVTLRRRVTKRTGEAAMIPHSEGSGEAPYRGPEERWALLPGVSKKGHVLVVEDEQDVRDCLGVICEDEGYEVSFAENGREALKRLYTETLPDIILLDLRMPVMNGWEFRAVQKDDPKLSLIPIVAISADKSAQAAAVSAQAHLRKPVERKDLLATVARVIAEKRRQASVRVDETERLASLGRLAAGVGHEINNPLAFVMMNLSQSLEKLRPSIRAVGAHLDGLLPENRIEEIRSRLVDVTDMLEDCQVGGERIRETVSNLQRLARQGDEPRGPLDVHSLINQSVSMVLNQIRHRARLVKVFGEVPPIRGNGTALGQVFLNLLVNAAQAIPEGDAERNEIKISTKVETDDHGAELVVEVRDSGKGIAPDVVPHVFEPFFTTKPIGQGTGLGLSISRQTVRDHGGHMTVESELGKGTVFRVFLPIGDTPVPTGSVVALASQPVLNRGRVLVIDDEPLIGRIIRTALQNEHDVFVVQRASEALTRLERGETFDLMLCDVVMPDLSGPEFYTMVAERWPQLATRLVFMTGGAFTPATVEFIERVPTRVLSKPFKIDQLKRLVRERMRGHS